MARKRKADDNLTGTRHPAARARTDTTAGEDLSGTSAQTSGPTASAACDGIAGTSQALAGLTAATTGSARRSSQFSGAARGARGGSGYRGFSQPHGRAPSQGMLRPPLGNPAGGRPPFPYQYHAPTGHGFFPGQNQIAGPLQTGTWQPQMPSQGMLRPPLDNPAGGRPPFIYQNHAPTSHGSLSGQTQNHVAGARQTGTGQPRGHSGSGGQPSSTISCASAAGAPVSPVGQECPRCKKPMIVFPGLGPVCADCYTNLVVSSVLQKHPEIRYVHPRPVPSHGGAPRGAAAIRPSSSSSSSSICQACGHPFRLFCLLCFDRDPALTE